MSRRYSRKNSSFHDEEVFDDAPHERRSSNRNVEHIPSSAEEYEFDRQYDLTPVAVKKKSKASKGRQQQKKDKKSKRSSQEQQRPEATSYPVDPWEIKSPDPHDKRGGDVFFPSTFSNETDSDENYEGQYVDDGDDEYDDQDDEIGIHGQDAADGVVSVRSTFLMPSDIHPRMEEKEDEIAQLRLLAGKLNADWGGQDFMAPALARRIRDFQFAQEKRRKKYGDEKPWGILGLYDHLASIR